MYSSDIRARARFQLRNNLFSKNWLYAALVSFLAAAIMAGLGYIFKKTSIPVLLATGPVSYSLVYMFLKQSRDVQEMSLPDMLIGFDHFGSSFLIGLLSHIFVVLWSFLFIIPGVIKMYAYSMAYYIKIDNPDLSAYDCLKASSQLMRGHKFELFMLDLSFIGWTILSIITGGIGFIWLNPYMQAAHANFYRALIQL